MDARDIERIVRDVLIGQGADVSITSIERHGEQWCVRMIDTAGRPLTHYAPDGPPASVRTAIHQWLDLRD